MKQNSKNEKALRAYLLGDLTSQEQEEMDGWLLSVDEAYDLLIAAEDELIDDSLNGDLTAHELDRLNSYFLVSEERQRKLQFSRTFRRFVHSTNRPKPSSSFWKSIAAFFQIHRALAYSTSALILLMMAGNVWFIFRTANLQLQLADAAHQREEMGRQLGEGQANLQSFEQAIAAAPDLQAMLSTQLSPLNLRSSVDIRKVPIAPNTHVVKFALELLEDGHYDSYLATLSVANDRVLFTSGSLPSPTGPVSKAVIFPVPANKLKDGEYRIKLRGIANSRSEDVSSFIFQVVSQ